MAYDSPEYSPQFINTGHITGVAGDSMQKFHFFQSVRLKRVSSLVVTAGTNANATVKVVVGTDTVATLAFGTNTAGVVVQSGDLDIDVPAMGVVELKGAANSATLVGAFQMEIAKDFGG